MGRPFTYLKTFTPRVFQKTFKAILWNNNLTYGARCFAFALLTVPPQSRVKLKKMAKKFRTSAPRLSVWKKELMKERCHVRGIEPIKKR